MSVANFETSDLSIVNQTWETYDNKLISCSVCDDLIPKPDIDLEILCESSECDHFWRKQDNGKFVLICMAPDESEEEEIDNNDDNENKENEHIDIGIGNNDGNNSGSHNGIYLSFSNNFCIRFFPTKFSNKNCFFPTFFPNNISQHLLIIDNMQMRIKVMVMVIIMIQNYYNKGLSMHLSHQERKEN